MNSKTNTKNNKEVSVKSFIKLLSSLIITFGLTAMCFFTAYVCTSGGSFFGYEFSPTSKLTHINVMLMGLDKGGTRTDVMILGQLNLVDGEIHMLQIPRDTYVKDNGRYDKKINSAYGLEKEKTVFKEVKQITGVTADKYVVVDTSSFRDLIDTIGGVDFEVPQDMNYDDPVQDLHIHLKAGFQHLDGDKAEQLVRFRSYPQGDIQRMKVQSDFIQATVDELFSLKNVFKVNDLVEDVSAIVDTNFSLNELLTYAPYIFSIDREKIVTHQLAGEPQWINGGSYVVPDYEGNAELVEKFLTPSSMSETKGKKQIEETIIGTGSSTVSVKKQKVKKSVFNAFTSVDIINASGGTVDTDKVSSELKEYKFNVRQVLETEAEFEETTVVSKKKSSVAAALSRFAGASDYILNPDKQAGSDITIIIGKDFSK